MGLVLFGKGTRAPMSLGIFGGYPGCNVGYSTFRRRNVDELPDELDELRGGAREDQFWGELELDHGDVQYVRFMGGGGYGDPIDRDPELVAEDVARGPRHRGPRTRHLRRRRRRRRGRRARRRLRGDASCARSGSGAARRPPTSGATVEPTRRCGSPSTSSGRRAARRSAPGAVRRSRPRARTGRTHAVAAPPARRERAARTAPPSGEFFLIEAFCPGCGTLLDADLAAGDDPPLPRPVARWPALIRATRTSRASFNLASWFLDRNLEEGRGDSRRARLRRRA